LEEYDKELLAVLQKSDLLCLPLEHDRVVLKRLPQIHIKNNLAVPLEAMALVFLIKNRTIQRMMAFML